MFSLQTKEAKDKTYLRSKLLKNDENAVWLDVGGTHHIKTGVDILTCVEGSILK